MWNPGSMPPTVSLQQRRNAPRPADAPQQQARVRDAFFSTDGGRAPAGTGAHERLLQVGDEILLHRGSDKSAPQAALLDQFVRFKKGVDDQLCNEAEPGRRGALYEKLGRVADAMGNSQVSLDAYLQAQALGFSNATIVTKLAPRWGSILKSSNTSVQSILDKIDRDCHGDQRLAVYCAVARNCSLGGGIHMGLVKAWQIYGAVLSASPTHADAIRERNELLAHAKSSAAREAARRILTANLSAADKETLNAFLAGAEKADRKQCAADGKLGSGIAGLCLGGVAMLFCAGAIASLAGSPLVIPAMFALPILGALVGLGFNGWYHLNGPGGTP